MGELVGVTVGVPLSPPPRGVGVAVPPPFAGVTVSSQPMGVGVGVGMVCGQVRASKRRRKSFISVKSRSTSITSAGSPVICSRIDLTARLPMATIITRIPAARAAAPARAASPGAFWTPSEKATITSCTFGRFRPPAARWATSSSVARVMASSRSVPPLIGVCPRFAAFRAAGSSLSTRGFSRGRKCPVPSVLNWYRLKRLPSTGSGPTRSASIEAFTPACTWANFIASVTIEALPSMPNTPSTGTGHGTGGRAVGLVGAVWARVVLSKRLPVAIKASIGRTVRTADTNIKSPKWRRVFTSFLLSPGILRTEHSSCSGC